MHETLHQAFEARALERKNALALKFGEQCLTYEELDARANQLASRLRKMGVGPEIPVALYLDRSLEMVVAILGVLKAGGCYVPIDLAYPKDRVSFMLEDAAARIVLTQANLLKSLPSAAAEVLCLDSEWPSIAEEDRLSQSGGANGNNAAYVIYTSGSTGKPKGVVVTHHNVLRLLSQTEHWYGFNCADVWPLFHSYAFDVSVWELWGSLLYGGRLVIVPYLVTRSPSDFYELLAREKVTVLNQTPSAFRQLIWAESKVPTPLQLTLRYVICAGEALELQSLKPWFDRHGDKQPVVVNMYGITETTVHSTYRPITTVDLENGAGSVIGVPIPDLQIYLVDDQLKPVPSGQVGEICVGGDGVVRGYLNRDDLTAARFVPDPFSSKPGVRMYRSGDLARCSERGELEYLGRMDFQVKIRGFRVELGEIESALNRNPAIRESVVIALDGDGFDKRLTAYLVPSGVAPTVTELREYLRPRIPEYMIPALFVFLPALPLNTNGKVDRRALPAPGIERPRLERSFESPRNEAEKTLANIWSAVLGVGKVGAFDNFFELGGDSIRSIAILSRAQEAGLNLSLQQMFEHPTVAGMAACAKPVIETAASRPFDLISEEDRRQLPEDVEDAYPVARLQLGMFFHSELEPASAIYHDVFSFRIESAFDHDKLSDALSLLIQRHPILRTSFHLAGFSEPIQMVHRQARFRLTVDDLTELNAAGRDAALADWIEREKRAEFDRTVAPLVRFHVQKYEENVFQFIVSFHHSCLDGWSLAAVVTEIFRDYAASLRGTVEMIPPPRTTYRDFVALERRSVEDAEIRRFWTRKMADCALQSLPRWPESHRAAGLEQVRGPEMQIEAEILEGLKEVGRRAGVPLKTVLLAAHQRVMSLLLGQTDVTSGLLWNGRPEVPDGEKVVGLFLNTLPLRTQLNGGTWTELAQHCFAAEREIAPMRRFPLAEIQKLNGGRPVFEAAFDFVQFHVYKDLQGGINLREGRYFEANDLPAFTTFMLGASGEGLEFHIDYLPGRLCRQQIEEMSAYYHNTLCAMAADPGARYDAFTPLPEAEKRKLLLEWNETQGDYPREARIQELFEQRAAEFPLKTAVVCGDQKWTYEELNRRADGIACRLLDQGVGPEMLVGICMDRTPLMVAALLAILKAGAAYVPLDPAFPRERLELMLDDSKLRLLVTESSVSPKIPATETTILCADALSQNDSVALGSAVVSTAVFGVSPKILLASDPAPFGVRETVMELAGGTPAKATETVALPIASFRLNDKNSPTKKVEATQSGRLAYVIYTSGSTGRPKGVEVVHGAVVNLLISAGKKIQFGPEDKLLSVTTLSFDIAALELFLPLISGGELILAPHDVTVDGTLLAKLIESSKATVMQATPTTWRLLIESGWNGKRDLRVICGGEAMPQSLCAELLPRVKEVWNFYGPTETTIWSTAWKAQPGAAVSIGRALANTQLYILDGRLHPVPVGVTGDLYIGGDGLARGYRGREDLTAEKFIANPFAAKAGARIYKTGDCARYLPDGTVECLGRVDHQVKIRGFRIELGDVETALRSHNKIAHAVVVAREEGGEKRLVGYVKSKNGPLLASDMREFVRGKVPAYMVPSHFVMVDNFPLTPNGKIDLRRLPAPDGTFSKSRAYMPPSTDDEKALAEVWQEVLGVKRVGVDDDFFEMGADSLSATRAFARINRRLGIRLPLRCLFENTTVAKLAAAMRNLKSNDEASPISARRRSRVVKLAR